MALALLALLSVVASVRTRRASAPIVNGVTNAGAAPAGSFLRAWMRDVWETIELVIHIVDRIERKDATSAVTSRALAATSPNAARGQGEARNASTSTRAESTQEPAAAKGDEGTPRSPRSETIAELMIENNCSEAADIFWIDFEGRERSYGRMIPGVTRTQRTFEGHLWKARFTSSGIERPIINVRGETTVELCEASDPMRRSDDAPKPDTESICSVASTTYVQLEVVNACPAPLQLALVDFDCLRQRWGGLMAPGETRTMQTGIGHVWLSLASDGRMLQRFIVDEARTRFEMVCP